MSRKTTSHRALSRKLSRRTLLAGSAAGAVAALTRFPAPAVAQAAPFKLGLLTVKTGPLAQGGIQMEQGVLTYLKEKNYTLGGRKVDFVSADTGGNPAGAKTRDEMSSCETSYPPFCASRLSRGFRLAATSPTPRHVAQHCSSRPAK